MTGSCLSNKGLSSGKFVAEHCTAEDLGALSENISQVEEEVLLSLDVD